MPQTLGHDQPWMTKDGQDGHRRMFTVAESHRIPTLVTFLTGCSDLLQGLLHYMILQNKYKYNMIDHILINIYILNMYTCVCVCNVNPIVSWVCLGGSHLEMSQASAKHVPGIIHVKGHGPRQIQIHTCGLSCAAGRVMLLKS